MIDFIQIRLNSIDFACITPVNFGWSRMSSFKWWMSLMYLLLLHPLAASQLRLILFVSCLEELLLALGFVIEPLTKTSVWQGTPSYGLVSKCQKSWMIQQPIFHSDLGGRGISAWVDQFGAQCWWVPYLCGHLIQLQHPWPPISHIAVLEYWQFQHLTAS